MSDEIQVPVKRRPFPVRLWVAVGLAAIVTHTWVRIEIMNARANYQLPGRERRDDGSVVKWRFSPAVIERMWREHYRWTVWDVPDDLDGPEADTYARLVRKLEGIRSTPISEAEEGVVTLLFAAPRGLVSDTDFKRLVEQVAAKQPVVEKDQRIDLGFLVLATPGATAYADLHHAEGRYTREQRERLLALARAHRGPLTPNELSPSALTALNPVTQEQPSGEELKLLDTLIAWAPLTAKEAARMEDDRQRAKARNDLLAMVSSWGLLQYLLAPLGFFMSLSAVRKARGLPWRAVAILSLVLCGTGWFLMHWRAYFTSLGW